MFLLTQALLKLINHYDFIGFTCLLTAVLIIFTHTIFQPWERYVATHYMSIYIFFFENKEILLHSTENVCVRLAMK